MYINMYIYTLGVLDYLNKGGYTSTILGDEPPLFAI